ncbi:ATP-binding protein [Flavobacterium sp.]|uniref:ATP-binding protein n=1 Tax=Flavobacterium sp. TaxID=239 RepID=UPI003B9AC76C
MLLLNSNLKILQGFLRYKSLVLVVALLLCNGYVCAIQPSFSVKPILFSSLNEPTKEQGINANIKADVSLDHAGERFSKLINILSFSSVAILSLLCMSLYRNNRIRKQSNQALKEKNQELQIAKERAEKASAVRSEFLSTVSHELRTPLHAITGLTHLLLSEKPEAHQLEYLNSLKFSANHLLNYINEILEITRIESNTLELDECYFDIRVLLQDLVSSIQELAKEHRNELILEIDDSIPTRTFGDRTKLSQVLLNLLNNSLKFTSNGSVKLLARVGAFDKDRVSIEFIISDTGIGIPKDKIDTVFDSFTQGSNEINRKYGGTGLGLAIVKRILSVMGSKIKVESEMGKGSTFSFTCYFTYEEVSNVQAPEKVVDESVLMEKKVLLVEDNKINQMITKRMLEKKSILCEIVETGEDAVSILKERKFDLVLMDVHLPGMNGTTATEQIRHFDSTTPIIALTAISLLENRDMLMGYGMSEVITKPFEPTTFYKTIAQFMNVSAE